MILLFLGVSGSGKDTQAELLGKEFGFKVVSTGKLLRDEIARGTPLGKRIDDIVNEGNWVDDEITHELLQAKLKETGNHRVILTGAVREVHQVELLDNTLKKLDQNLARVVLFQLSETEAVRRLSGRRLGSDGKTYHLEFNPPPAGMEVTAREDDQPEAIAHRFKEYNESIRDILEAYRRRGLLVEVNADQSISDVHKELKAKLEL
jgi:adenylate kinase